MLPPSPSEQTKNSAGAQVEQFLSQCRFRHPGLKDADFLRHFPRHYEQFGHVVVVKVNFESSRRSFTTLAGCFARSFDVPIGAVVVDAAENASDPSDLRLVWKDENVLKTACFQSGIALRRGLKGEDPALEDLTTSPTFTSRIENGIHYYFDVMEEAFVTACAPEREYISGLLPEGETVLVLFANIGEYAVPLAVHGAAKVIAIEKDPKRIENLRFISVVNGVADVVAPLCGSLQDGSYCLGQCDRVIAGMPVTELTAQFCLARDKFP